MAEESPVLTELQGNIGVVTLNRPGKFNCISRGLADGLSAAVRSLEANAQCRVVVLNANGKHFCTGADLDEVLAARETRATLEAFITAGHDALTALEHSRLPIVAVVHGLCLAGGLELMMACDVVVAANSARFGDQHAQYGLIPGWGGTQRLPRMVGLRRALHLMYSAEWLDAVTAREWGLVNLVVEEAALAERAMTYAQTLEARNPQTIAAMKSLARKGLDVPLAEGLARECECVVDALRSENVSEGLAAFQARRIPKFS
jgi:enoyl-CoA hydratase/carnithine racemase